MAYLSTNEETYFIDDIDDMNDSDFQVQINSKKTKLFATNSPRFQRGADKHLLIIEVAQDTSNNIPFFNNPWLINILTLKNGNVDQECLFQSIVSAKNIEETENLVMNEVEFLYNNIICDW